MVSNEQRVIEHLWKAARIDVDPPNIDDCDIEVLSDQLINAATLTSKFQQKFIDYLHLLACNQFVTWCQFLRSIKKYNKFQNFNAVSNLCKTVTDIVPQIQSHSFHNPNVLNELVETVCETFTWLLRVSKASLQQIDWCEDESPPYLHSLAATYQLIHDQFCGRLVGTKEYAADMTLLREIEEIYKQNKETGYGEEAAVVGHLIDQISQGYHLSFITEKFQNLDCNLEIFKIKNPTVRILTSIFSCYRVMMPFEEVADIYYIFSQIMNIPFENVVFDMLHAVLLIRSQEHIDLPFLPKNRRIDFRWHIGIFYYMKMSKIWSILIQKYKQPKQAIVVGLRRVMKELHRTLDIADLIWRDCSIRSLLAQLKEDNLVDEDSSNEIIEIRIGQMKKNPELDKLTGPAEVILSDADRTPSDCSILKSSLANVGTLLKPQNLLQEKMVMSLPLRIAMGDGFDSIVANLCIDNKLSQYANALSDLNFKAQTPTCNVPDRMQNFDLSFLLLTRITIKWPSVPIKALIDPNTNTESEGIFYQWSTRFLKRVRKLKQKPEEEKKENGEQKKEENVKEGEKKKENDKKKEEEDNEEEKEHDEEKELENEKKEEEEEKKEGEEEKKEVEEEKKELTEEKKDVEDEKIGGVDEKQQANDDKKEEVERTEEEETKERDKEKQEEKKKENKEEEEKETRSENPEKDKKENKEDEKSFEFEPPLPKVDKEVVMKCLQKLKEREPFWENNEEFLDISSIIHTVPAIGEILLEEFGGKRVNRDHCVENLINILFALQNLSSFFVCLIQWLDCQKDSPARRSFASAMLQAIEKTGDKTTSKWIYIQSFMGQIIEEMSEKEPVYPEVMCTAFSTSRRFCPRILRDEFPDALKMKSAWYYMQNQGWATPHALRLLEHSNLAGEYDIWSQIFMSKTIKMGCGDAMTKCVDMIASFQMIDHLNCLIRMHESLYDFWFSEAADNTNDGRFEPGSLMPIIRLMTNVMLLVVWALEQQKQKCEENGPPLKKIAFDEQILTPELDDPDSPAKWVHLFDNMINVTINRFMKTLRKGVLSPVVCAISHLMKSIAGAQESKPKRLLLKRINPKLIFELAYIDPCSVSYEMLQEFCDPKNEQHNLEKIRFLCAQRRRNVI